MSNQRVPGGVVHELPTDLRKAPIANAEALHAWTDLTRLAATTGVSTVASRLSL